MSKMMDTRAMFGMKTRSGTRTEAHPECLSTRYNGGQNNWKALIIITVDKKGLPSGNQATWSHVGTYERTCRRLPRDPQSKLNHRPEHCAHFAQAFLCSRGAGAANGAPSIWALDGNLLCWAARTRAATRPGQYHPSDTLPKTPSLINSE